MLLLSLVYTRLQYILRRQFNVNTCVCLYMYNHVDHLTLEKIHITGPPPPARLDHAMCTIYLTTVTSISTGTTDSVQESCSTSSPTGNLLISLWLYLCMLLTHAFVSYVHCTCTLFVHCIYILYMLYVDYPCN